jgi:hypothetical protein
MALWKVNGFKPEFQPEPLRDHPDIAPHFPWVWGWFFDLRPGITWTELEAWARMRGIKPSGWECELLIRLDTLR